MKRALWWLLRGGLVLVLFWGMVAMPAWAGPVSDRLSSYPHWFSKPPTQPAKGDLFYPAWFEGDWLVTTTLTDLVAPLAPEMTTPGFEGNRSLLHQPVTFKVRFHPERRASRAAVRPPQAVSLPVVADRAYNGLNLSRAYLGDRLVQAVKGDPTNPNRQITRLRGDRLLVSTVTARATESPEADQFLTSEVYRQEFRSSDGIYFNDVETTTRYQHTGGEFPLVADQVTAVYLSPQDANYFKAGDRPIALYRYRLSFRPLDPSPNPPQG